MTLFGILCSCRWRNRYSMLLTMIMVINNNDTINKQCCCHHNMTSGVPCRMPDERNMITMTSIAYYYTYCRCDIHHLPVMGHLFLPVIYRQNAGCCHRNARVSLVVNAGGYTIVIVALWLTSARYASFCPIVIGSIRRRHRCL